MIYPQNIITWREINNCVLIKILLTLQASVNGYLLCSIFNLFAGQFKIETQTFRGRLHYLQYHKEPLGYISDRGIPKY